MRSMRLIYFFTGGLFVLGLVSVSATSYHVVTHVGHNAVISLNVSQAGGDFKVGVEVNNVTEYLFLIDTDITIVNNSRTWYRDRYRVRGNITSSVFRLTLYNVTTEDAGIYECRKFDINQRVRGCEQLLIVAQNPSQPNITGPDSAVSGASVTLTCSSSSRSQPPDHPPLTMTYTWRRNSEEIQGGGDVPVDGPNLTMRDISSDKEGNYTCQAVEEGLVSDWSHGHVLDVLYGPHTVQFNETDDKVTVTEGDPLTVRCSAECNPACTVTWSDTSRQKVTSGQREAVLYIPAVNISLSDLYTCHVNNTHGNKSRNLKLDIQSEPGVSNVVSTAVICSVLVVLVAVVLAILLYRHKAKKGKRPYRVGADKEDQLQQDPSHLYSKVNKRKRAGPEVSDVYEPVKLDSPRQFMNWMYGARPSSERMVLINKSDHTPGVTNNCGKRNEDGLIYADLDLDQSTLVDGIPIIHSREEPVVYEEIDFFLTPGPQLPDKIWEVEDDDCL